MVYSISARSYVAPIANTALKLASSKSLTLTAVALAALSNIPSAYAGQKLVMLCRKSCIATVPLELQSICVAGCAALWPFSDDLNVPIMFPK